MSDALKDICTGAAGSPGEQRGDTSTGAVRGRQEAEGELVEKMQREGDARRPMGIRHQCVDLPRSAQLWKLSEK